MSEYTKGERIAAAIVFVCAATTLPAILWGWHPLLIAAVLLVGVLAFAWCARETIRFGIAMLMPYKSTEESEK